MKAKQFFILLLAVCLPFGAIQAANNAETTLYGQIKDAHSGEALTGVSVYFPELQKGSLTDEKGHYEIKKLPAIKATIRVALVGHQTIFQEVDLKTVHELNFILKENNATLGEVVVTGFTGSTQMKKLPTPVSVVSNEDLQKRSVTNIIDALSKQPGLSQITTGNGISKPVIRGLGFNRVAVVNDGVRQEGQQWGDEHGIEIDEQSVHTVEILKGPASLIYGSDAMAGVLVFRDAPTLPEGTIRGNATTGFQTNSGLFNYSLSLGGNNNGWVWRGLWSDKMAHDYKNKRDGYVYNSRFREQAVTGLLGLNQTWGYSHLKLSYFHLVPGIIEGERDGSTGGFIKPVLINGQADETVATRHDGHLYSHALPYQKVNHYKAVWDNSILLGEGQLKAIIGYQQNKRKEFEEVESPNTAGLDFKLHTINYNLHYQTAEMKGWKSAFGVNGMYQKSENLGEEYLIPAYHLFDFGIFGTTSRTFAHWTLTGGLRYDTRHLRSDHLLEEGTLRFEAFSRTFNGLTGSVGTIYNMSERLNLRLNLSRGFRSPNMSELGSNGKHEGTVRYEIGNKNLKPEFSSQIDLGLDYSSPIVSYQLSLFFNHVDNYIFSARRNGVIINGTPVYQFQSGDARIWGGEAMIDVHPVERLHFENSFSYVHAVQLHQSSDCRYLPFTPAPRWISTLSYDLIRDGHRLLNNTFVGAEMECNLKQDHFYAHNQTETATPSYTIFSFKAGTDFLIKGKKAASLVLTADNIFDRAYQNNLSRLKYADLNPVTGRRGVYNMGRNFNVKLIVPINL